MPLGLAAIGPLAEAIGVEAALWVTFGLGAVIVLALLDLQVRSLPAGRPAVAAETEPVPR